MENRLKIISYAKASQAPDIEAAMKKRLKKLLVLFRREEFIGDLFRTAKQKNFIELPSIYSNHLAKCSFNIYSAGKNFLRFADRNGKIFYVIQNPRYFLHSVYLPEENIIFSNVAGKSQITPMLRSFHNDLKNVEKISTIESRRNFLGVINGYSRPYHYFRDKITTLLFLEEYLADMPILTLQDQAFLNADLINDGPESLVSGSLNSYIIKHEGFALDPAGSFSPTYRNNMQFAAASVRKKICAKFENTELAELLAEHSPVIWFGVCSQKRTWLNQTSTVAALIDSIIAIYPNALFIFDGLTAPVGSNEDEFRNTVAVGEVKSLEAIWKKVKTAAQARYLSLIGAHAEKKIFAGNKVDFFLSSALTDSIWIAHFNRKRGMAYVATVAKTDEHYHPKTYIVPTKYVRDEESADSKNWSTVNYYIDSDFVRWSFLNGLAQWMQQKQSGDKLHSLSINGGSPTVLSPIDAGGTRLEVDFDEGENEIFSVGDEAKSYNRSARAYKCLSEKYDFLADAECHGEANCEMMIVGYGAGNRAEQYQVGTKGGQIQFSAGIDRFRVFMKVQGKGIIDFYGYRAQPVYLAKGEFEAQ